MSVAQFSDFHEKLLHKACQRRLNKQIRWNNRIALEGKRKNQWVIKAECDQKSNEGGRTLVKSTEWCFVLQHCIHRTIERSYSSMQYWSEHRFSRPITVILTLQQWLMSRKSGCLDVTPKCLWSYRSHWLYSMHNYSLFVLKNVKNLETFEVCYGVNFTEMVTV